MNDNVAHQMNYITSNRFYIEMESSIRASFTECSGMEVKIKNKKVPTGGVNDQQRIILEETEFTDVVLKRGSTDDLAFWEWISQVWTPGQSMRRTINILGFNQAGETMQCWTLTAAVPVGWKSAALKADANTLAIEELTLAYEGLKITKSGGGGATILPAARPSTTYYG